MSLVPMVIQNTPQGERSFDIYSRLLNERIIMLTGQVEDNMAASICAQLLHLDSESSEDIFMYINSPGGVVTSGMAIYDTMNFINCDVSTVCMGQAASMGAHLLASGTKGKRFALPNARIMIHQPLGGFQGQATDIQIHAKEILNLKDSLNKMLAGNCNQKLSKVENDVERDYFLTAKDAKEYGLIDQVIANKPK